MTGGETSEPKLSEPGLSTGPEFAKPLNRYQRDIVAVALTYPDLPLAQPSGYLRLPGANDVDRLKDAIRRTALRHDAMRLRLEIRGDEWRQWVQPDYPDVEVVSFLPGAEPGADPRDACRRWITRTTDTVLAQDGPLAQMTILIDEPDSLIVYGRFHHAVADGWGINIIINDIRAGYWSPGDARASAPAPSCLDIVEAEAAYRDSPDWRADRAALVAAIGPLTPARFARTATVRGHRRRRWSTRIDAPAADRIRATGRSIFSFSTAVLASYLRRVHRDGDIVLGIPLLNRRTAAELATVSDVTNILPLHVPVDEDRSLLDIADRIRSGIRDLVSHQRFALGDLRTALREEGYQEQELFDVTYSYITIPGGESDDGVETTVLASGYSLDAVNIVVREYERDGSLDLDVFYAEDVFDDDWRVEAAIGHLANLLDEGLRRPAEPVRTLAILDEAQTARIGRFERPDPVGLDQTSTLDRLLTAQASRTPDRPAVVGSDADGLAYAISYAEFHRRVARLASHLRDRGLRPDECVPIILPRSLEFLVAVHAVQAAGGAYVPVDPQYPPARIRTVLTDCKPRLAIGGPGEVLNELGIRSVPVSPPESGEEITSSTRPTDLAYVIYTSGSTGTPKGVMIEHRSVVNRLAWMQRRYPLRHDDVILHKTPATFDVSVWELMWWAQVGARVAVAPVGAERDPRELTAAIERHAVTVMHFVPSMLGPFLDHLDQDPRAAGQVRSLRRVFCSGEALTPALAERFRKVFARTGVQLVNLYGPTEATVDVSYFDIPDSGPIARVPIGRPIDNIALMVLDRAGRRCPIGVPGELNIAGVGLARGYLGQPAGTDERFVVDRSIPEQRRYRTGDLARWLSDGAIEYLGRLDDQVKVRGNRVSLGEVERTLVRCPSVAAAAVVDEHTDAGTRLVGYVVAAVDPDPNHPPGDWLGSVVDFLADRLPAYMIPAEFVRLDRIPLTANGKVDRRALPAPDNREDGADRPGNPIEEALVGIWSAVLRSPGFGVNDNFFTVGGDSILALRMRTEAEKRGLAFDLERFYARPTIAGLAAVLATNDRASTVDATGAGSREGAVSRRFQLVPLIDLASLSDVEDAFPASQLQLGMLYHSLQKLDSTLYKDVFRYRLVMPWHEAQFRRAYRRLVRNQPVLRSNFDLTGRSIPLQIVYPELPDALEIAADGADVEAYTETMHRADYPLVDARSTRPASLHRMRVFVRPDGIDLVFSFHHAILDGWSVANLVRELLLDYLAPQPAGQLPSGSTLLLAEHVRAERASRQDAAARMFWARAVADSRPTTIESLQAHVATARGLDSSGGRDRILSVPSWLDRSVKRFVRKRGVPMKSVLLAAHCLALRAMSGSANRTDDVITGCVTHTRPELAGAERCAGLFLNTIPVRLDARVRTYRDAVEQIVRWERDTFAYRRFPVSAIGTDRRTPVFETAFNFVNYHALGEALADQRITLVDVAVREETNFALLTTAAIDPRDGGILLRISAGGGALTGFQCVQFGRLILSILGEIVRDPDAEIDLSAASWYDVAELVAQVRTEYPTRAAVVHAGCRWDYRRLSDTADAIGQELLRRGMPRAARVAIRMRRSAELIAVVLGVLRAGAAVIPLDPSYPAARIRSMVEIARPYLTIAEPDLGTDLVDVTELVAPAGLITAASTGDAVPLPRIHPGDIAYVLFTSGSTGEPKGVAMPHRALTNLIDWQHRRATGGTDRRTLQYAPLSFDVAFQEIFSTLCAAGTLQLIDEPERQDMAAVLRAIDEGAVHRLYLPYIALQALAEVAVATGRYPLSLRSIVSSGEQLRITPEIRALCVANPGLVLENQYGPTETHVALAYQLPRAVAEHPALPPVGTAISQTSVTVLDDLLRPVPAGVPGEIYIEGACLAQGYERRPGLTAQRFVAGPAGRVRYRTGDIGVVLAGGDIACLGRADGQVKVRGYRVECAEVELAVLAGNHAGIEQVAVVARELSGADAVLQAFLVGDPDLVDTGTLRAELAKTLPSYMVPARLRWIAAMPRTPSGKRDDAALRALAKSEPGGGALSAPAGGAPSAPAGGAPSAPAGGAPSAPAGGQLEQEIAGLLAEFAGVDALAVDANFFDAGGTSIGATRASMTIARRWGVELPLPTFLSAPTARQLAAVVKAGDARRTFDPVVVLRNPGEPEPGDAPLFLVHPIGGNVLCYRELVRHLPGNRPVYGLQAAGTEPGTTPLANLRSLAAGYIAAIRRVHPAGPFHIAGWSFGGYVAIEIARQLDEAAVSSVVLLDTIALDQAPRPAIDDHQLAVLFLRDLLYSAGQTATGDWPDGSGQSVGQLFESVLRQTVRLGILHEDGSPQLLRRLYEVFRANYRAAVDYRVETLPSRLLLLRAAEKFPADLAAVHRMVGSMFDSPSNGWQRWAEQPIEAVTVPGDHLSMMDAPNAQVVAGRLGEALARAEVAVGSGHPR